MFLVLILEFLYFVFRARAHLEIFHADLFSCRIKFEGGGGNRVGQGPIILMVSVEVVKRLVRKQLTDKFSRTVLR